jgi:hypothetical protein
VGEDRRSKEMDGCPLTVRSIEMSMTLFSGEEVVLSRGSMRRAHFINHFILSSFSQLGSLAETQSLNLPLRTKMMLLMKTMMLSS